MIEYWEKEKDYHFDKIWVSRNKIKTEKSIRINKTGIKLEDVSLEKILKAQFEKERLFL